MLKCGQAITINSCKRQMPYAMNWRHGYRYIREFLTILVEMSERNKSSSQGKVTDYYQLIHWNTIANLNTDEVHKALHQYLVSN